MPTELVVKGTNIRLLTYDLVMAGANIAMDVTKEKIEQGRIELLNKIGDTLWTILRFVPLGQNANCAIACKRWSYGANNYPDYVDVRNFLPWQGIKCHNAQVILTLIGFTVVFLFRAYL